MSRASSVKALSRGVCKLGPSGGTALGVKVRSSATPTCPWFLIVDRNVKRQLEPDEMRPARVRKFKYFVIQVYGTRSTLSTTLFIRSYTYGNITWCYLVILVLWFFTPSSQKDQLHNCARNFCRTPWSILPFQSNLFGILMEHCIIGALVSDISLAPKQLLGGRGWKREPGCWCYPLDQPIGRLRPSPAISL